MTPGDMPSSDALQEERDALSIMQSGQLELARYKIAMLSKKYPDVAKFHFNYALVLYKLKRYDEALEEINAGLWLKPDDLKAANFKKEIAESRLKANAAEAGKINDTNTSTTITCDIAPKTHQIPAIIDEEGITPPVALSFQPEPGPATEPEHEMETSQPVTSVQSTLAGDIEHTTGLQHETMPAIKAQPPKPVQSAQELEVMPSINIPALPDGIIITTEPTIKPVSSEPASTEVAKDETVPEIAPAAAPPEPALVEAQKAEPVPEIAPAAAPPEPAPVEAQKAEPFLENAPIESQKVEPVPEPAPAAAPPEPALVEAAKAELVQEITSAAAPPEPVPTEAVKVEPVPETAPAATILTQTESLPHIEQERPIPEMQAENIKQTEFTSESESPVEPMLVSSIPGPAIIETKSDVVEHHVLAETIEIEPHITIHEKAADITVGTIDNPPSATHEGPASEGEPLKAPITAEVRDNEQKPSVPGPRLTNLKDLFKGSRARAELDKERTLETSAVLPDTIELEPNLEHISKGTSNRVDDAILVSFSSFKELESYKFSIQALVEKYLHHKFEHEIPDSGDDDTFPVIVEQGMASFQEEPPFSEADLPPHEAASITDAESPVSPLEEPSSITEPLPKSLPTTIVATSEHSEGSHGPATAPGNGSNRNVVSNQQALTAVLSTPSGHLPHNIDFDIAKYINAIVMRRARTGNLMQVRGESLAQIVDMETYATLARLNRAIVKGKTSKLNTNKLKSADETIMNLESGVQPMKSYRPGNLLKDESADSTEQFNSLVSGQITILDDDVLNKIVEHVREVGLGQAMMRNDGDDAPLKAATAKIKRAALNLYNNNQYEQAASIYEAFTENFPEDFEALFNLGFCYREIGNYNDAEATFKRIIELFYDNAYAWYNLSVIYSITTDGDKEAYCLQRAREFGYAVDVNRLSRLLVTYTPKNPFDA